MKRLFIDMDKIVVDSELIPISESIEAIKKFIDIGCCQIYLVPALKEITIVDYCLRFDWVKKYLPELASHFIISSVMDKFADDKDMLISHEYHDFPGILVDFSKDEHDWAYIINIIESVVQIEMP